MSEQSDDGDDLSGCVFIIVFTVVAAIALIFLLNRLDRQDNYIRDLQRRIAVLEQERR